ncbi:phosphoenolpyruvate synthase/pyruvate phosphate dikinase [Cylindrospermum stagnale PCC 7417]|uniref:Phosphoenolpyruvate synthase n=1 Tax=Cylindrospermum stagnale PCC 7417 TaxID=56107 RepID=K9X2E1_9NOST|nr:putative PEP-binding protein [Cylindrospermum stagnale]AFZ25902.1 phosphoenolpyruvate synthase/pyruvate phosphate dikinase [Cylindrospermum stagnale PCC 7417]
MDKLYWLDQIKLQDRAKVGDKAYYLSRIMQRGYPVVPGFVVSAEVLREFLETLNSSESLVADLPHSSLHLDVANWRQLQQVAGRLRREIISASVPPQWASKIFTAASEWQTGCLIFRPTLAVSTGTHGVGNLSGLLESVFCPCNEEAIANALKRTWSQLFRARSLLYWQQAGINLQRINLAVLVQPVENAIASGLLNTNRSTWEIEATWGLGMALANGEVLPDAYHIQPETGVVLERQLGNKMLAYRVDDAASTDSWQPVPRSVLTADSTSLVAYLLEESQQKQYALPEEYLQQLIALGTQLVSEIGTTLTMKWTIAQTSSDPKLLLTQVSPPQSVIKSSYFIKALGASGGRVMGTAYIIGSSQPKPEQLPKGVILIASVVTPDWLPLLQQVAGIITERGGLTSHAAILARELCIPAVVSATDATTLIQNGERLLLDGDRGEVYRIKSEVSEKVQARISSLENLELNSLQTSSPPLPRPPLTSHLPMIATQLLINLSQSSLIEQVQSLPVDGVGLLRSELMVLTILEGQHPHSWLLGGRQAELLERWSEQIRQFAQAFAPRPVFYRSLDWRSQDLPSLSDSLQSSPQSMLGERGTYSYLQNPAVFELELQALAAVQASGYSNIHLILPFVRTVEEFIFCRRKVEQAGLTQSSQFQLWMMAEVPSVLFLLPEYVKAGVAGISIGTNDLTQLLLGVDREQGQLAKIFDERHPAVMGAIAQLIKMARVAGIPCSICGQAPALYPEIIDQLVQWGITSISVEPEAFERTHQAIARAEQRLILAAARRQLGEF